MSRAYRICVREQLRRVLRAQDRVGTRLELLEILPAADMQTLLSAELEQRGFERRGKLLLRKQHGTTISVEPETGTVTVQTEAAERVRLRGEGEGTGYEDLGPSAEWTEVTVRHQVREDLERQANARQTKLETEVTERLEGELRGLRQELDQVVNRVTAEALKQKAAQLGRIKEISEDSRSGSLTIVLEV